MKKLLVILFALGLVFAFSAPVMAVDVSFDGQYRIRGWYDSNSALVKDNATSSAYYDQRMRVGTTFQVAEGLKVTTRFDALEGVWGTSALRNASVSTTNTYTNTGHYLGFDETTSQSQGNVQFDKAYVTFMTGIGQFEAGYFSDGVWGTGFGDLEVFLGKIAFTTKLGPVFLYLNTTKITEADYGTTYSDADADGYVAALMYKADGIDSGLLYKYKRIGYNLQAATLYGGNSLYAHAVIPYVKATFGDLYLEAELAWVDGESDNNGVKARDLEGLAYYAKAQYNIGAAYVGGLFAYVQGDDPSTTTTENMANSGGDWDPMLILFNDTCPTALGSNATSAIVTSTAMTGTSMNNGYIYQVFAGAAIDKLSLKASLAYAKADETGGTVADPYVDKDYGTEFDVTAAYKIYDNLTYTAGFGYLWAGDYYKGADATNEIDDTYLLMNNLVVSF